MHEETAERYRTETTERRNNVNDGSARDEGEVTFEKELSYSYF